MKVVPLGDHVVIRRIDAPLVPASAIVLPDPIKDYAQQGRILSVGDGLRLADGSLSPHQRGFVGCGNHDHGSRETSGTEVILQKLLHFAPAFADEADDGDVS